MTLFDFEELCGYWEKNPPTHLMVAAYLGIGKEKKKSGPDPFAGAIARAQAQEARPATPADAMSALAAAGMFGSPGFNIHTGFAVTEAPLTFDDIKRFNGL